MEESNRKKLREEYENRRPVKGIVCWISKDSIWAAATSDAESLHNRTAFQLRLGSWTNREMQKEYIKSPESFEWKLVKELEYKDPLADCSEKLDELMLEFLEEYPDAKPMQQGKKFNR